MARFSRTIPVPLFWKIQSDVVSRIDQILRQNHLHFERAFVLFDEKTFQVAGDKLKQGLAGCWSPDNYHFVTQASIDEARELLPRVSKLRSDLIVGVGGGTVLDVGKFVSTRQQLSFLSIPTTLSNDGILSPVAVLKDGGQSRSLGVDVPIGTLVDLDLVKTSPLRQLRSGIGDLLSNLSALQDWKLAAEHVDDVIDDFAWYLAESSVEQLFLITNNHQDHDLTSPQVLEALAQGLVMSGMAMTIAGTSKPCSGAEHKFSHALDKLFGGVGTHGEQVAVGTVIASLLRDAPLEKTLEIFRRFGVPYRPKDIGLDLDKGLQALTEAPAMRPDRYTILDHLNADSSKLKEVLQQANEL